MFLQYAEMVNLILSLKNAMIKILEMEMVVIKTVKSRKDTIVLDQFVLGSVVMQSMMPINSVMTEIWNLMMDVAALVKYK